MHEYDPKDIEQKWQKIWHESGIYWAKDDSDKPKYYSLIEFPYPSGDGLHVGHPRPYIGLDVISRKRRMQGFNVLYPIGWDAFGLPTENYAIKTGRLPAEITKENTDTFRRQIQSLGISFDWSREVNTTDPQYYKWTQWIFLKLLEHGLAYKAKMPINWCPKDKIGLANEEVVDGKCERCGTPVEQREKEQWMLAITKYADKLLSGLEEVDYPERVKAQQRNWIGKSEGALIKFDDIEVFTTRPDTIFGATFIVVSGKEDKFTGRSVTNPATGEKIPVWEAEYVMGDYGTGAIMGVPAHDERDFEFATKHDLPIRVVIDPVLGKPHPNPQEKEKIVALVMDGQKVLTINWGLEKGGRLLVGGTAEEGEDLIKTAQREIAEETGYDDLSFVAESEEKVHYQYFSFNKNTYFLAHTKALFFKLNSDRKIPIKLEENEKGWFTVEWVSIEQAQKEVIDPLHRYALDKFVGKQCYSGEGLLRNSGEFSDLRTEEARKKIAEKFGELKTTYKLRDWVFSRQRYWGEPIPVVHCEQCGIVPVPEKDLPVVLPEVENYQPTDTGESPLSKIEEWVNTTCPKCGGAARRETDTMPNWAGSSWYFLRYADPGNDEVFADKKKLEYWMPIDWYNGGMEHTVLHLLYSRFWNKFLYDIGLVPVDEPYKKRTSHGLILAEGGEKMSKSKGNVVNPDAIVERFGADTLRVYEMFMGPFEQAIEWSESSLLGPRRFLERVWKLRQKISNSQFPISNEFSMNQTIKRVSEDTEGMKFNTAISTLMIFANELEKEEKISQEEYETLLKLLAPFAPHMTEELWHELGHSDSLHLQSWPQYDETKLVAATVSIVVQVNGKVRGSFEIDTSVSEEEVQKRALALPAIEKWLAERKVEKTIYVPGKLVNFVLS